MAEIIKKNNYEEIRIATKSFKGKAYVDVRLYYLPKVPTQADLMLPSPRGVTVPLDKWAEFTEKCGKIDITKIEEEGQVNENPNQG